jgi:uridine kinase
MLARVRALVAETDRPPVVAIAGCGGAGKSTLALKLAKDVGVHEDQVVGTDGLYARTDTGKAPMWELHD